MGEVSRPPVALRGPAVRQAWGGPSSLLRPRNSVGRPPAVPGHPRPRGRWRLHRGALWPREWLGLTPRAQLRSRPRPPVLTRAALPAPGVQGRRRRPSRSCLFVPPVTQKCYCCEFSVFKSVNLFKSVNISVLIFPCSNLLIFSFLATPKGRLLFFAFRSLIRLERACVSRGPSSWARDAAHLALVCTWGSGNLGFFTRKMQQLSHLGVGGTLLMHHTRLGHGSLEADGHCDKQQSGALNRGCHQVKGVGPAR